MAEQHPTPTQPAGPYQFTILGLLTVTTLWAVLLGIMKSLGTSVPVMIGVSQFFAGVGLVLLGSARFRLWLVARGAVVIWTAWLVPLILRAR